MANAVEHAYLGSPGLVRVQRATPTTQLLVTVEDEGKWKPAQRRDERGRGLPLMRALMDGVEIRTHQARTEVRLTMMLARGAASRPEAGTARTDQNWAERPITRRWERNVRV